MLMCKGYFNEGNRRTIFRVYRLKALGVGHRIDLEGNTEMVLRKQEAKASGKRVFSFHRLILWEDGRTSGPVQL